MVSQIPISSSRREYIGDQQSMMAVAALKSPQPKKEQTKAPPTGLDIGQQQEIMGSKGILVFAFTP